MHRKRDPILQQALTGPRQLKSVGHNLHKNNLKLTCSWTNVQLRDEQGLVLSIVSMVEDLTERTHAAQRMVHVARHERMKNPGAGLAQRGTAGRAAAAFSAPSRCRDRGHDRR